MEDNKKAYTEAELRNEIEKKKKEFIDRRMAQLKQEFQEENLSANEMRRRLARASIIVASKDNEINVLRAEFRKRLKVQKTINLVVLSISVLMMVGAVVLSLK
jgi:uncharacterized protein YbcI